MKTFTTLAVLLLASVMILPAAPLQLSGTRSVDVSCALNASIDGPLTVSCPGATAPPGALINSITLLAVGTWQDSRLFGPTFAQFAGSSDFTFTTVSNQFTIAELFGTAVSTTGSGSTGLLQGGPVPLVLSSLDPFTVEVARTITSGLDPINETVTVLYQYTYTPEPGTFALIGIGLGIAALLRRRKKPEA